MVEESKVRAGSLIHEDELLPDPLNDRKCRKWHMAAKRLTVDRLFDPEEEGG